MIITEQNYNIINYDTSIINTLEYAGRTCHQSKKNMGCTLTAEERKSKCSYEECTPGCEHHSSQEFVSRVRRLGHESVLEHGTCTVSFITNRGTTHELVRHRHTAYSQESTRYCNYKSDHIQFIRPVTFEDLKPATGIPFKPIDVFGQDPFVKLGHISRVWVAAMCDSEYAYHVMSESGARPEEARGVLPIDLKTELVMTTNFTQWRHTFKRRCVKAAHPQVRSLMKPLLRDFIKLFPCIFEDLEELCDE